VLTFNKTIDLMRQMRDMLTDVLPDHPVRWTLLEAERLLRRGIVEQSLTLGFAPLVLGEHIEAAEQLEPDPETAPEPPKPARRRKPEPDPVTADLEAAAEPVRRRRKTTPIETVPVVEAGTTVPPRKKRGSKQPEPV